MVCPMESEIGEAFSSFPISSQRGPKIIHQSPFQGNKNNKGLGLPRASRDNGSSSILPPEAGIRVGFATNPIKGAGRADNTPGVLAAGHADSTPPGTKSQGLLALAMKKIAKIFNL